MNYLKSKYFIVLVFIVSVLASLSTLSYFKNAELRSFLTLQTAEAQHRYNGMVLFPQETSDIIYTTLINTTEVIDIFKYADQANEKEKLRIREALLKHLLNSYINLTKYNIQQLHFHLPNNDSFLRFHRPGKYGDNLTSARQTIAYANKNLSKTQGFEEGKVFSGYRFVYPLFDENQKHIGSVEVSHSANTLTTMYQRAFEKSNLNIVLKKDLVSKKLFSDEMKNYEEYILNNNFLKQKSLQTTYDLRGIKENIEDLALVQEKMNNFENFSIPVGHEAHYDLVSFTPIKNPITKEFIAYAISFQKSEWLNYFFSEYKRQIIFNIFVSFLISLGLYLILRFYFALEKQAHYDSLMKIYNRFFFEQYLNQQFKFLDREENKLSLIMFDIDHFKNINDTYGHKAGDDALKFLAEVVNNNIRKSDMFARWGGEEFMILVEDDIDTAIKIAENLREKIDKLTEYQANVAHFTCSFGIIALDNNISLDDSYNLVDNRLYKAKEKGRNRVVSS